jgi:threonine dehydrogenase-like Zn-dependent dehydrogenase
VPEPCIEQPAGAIYPPADTVFPIGKAMNKDLTIRMSNGNHRRTDASLIGRVLSGTLDPAKILTAIEPVRTGIESYEAFERRQPGWIKVALHASAKAAE